MSLITRCPACGTMFKVVPDQLRISEGWVRCGHCADVFDASANLQEPPSDIEPQPPGGLPAEEPTAPDSLPPFDEPGQLPAVPPKSPQELSAAMLSQGVGHAATEPADSPDTSSSILPSLPLPLPLPLPPPPPIAPEMPDLDAKDSLIDRTDVAMYPPFEESYDSSQYPSSMLPEEHENVPFVRAARRKAFWRRGPVRAVVLLVGVALLVGLAFQVTVQERDRIAAWDPRTRPWLEQLCAQAGCQLAPLRQIESLVIDGSSFTKVRGDAYRLGITLRNTASLPLALPAIELALTDTQDQPVIRRVLLPSELGATTGMLDAGGEWSGNFTLAVTANGSAGRIAGYRLLAFYP